MNKHDREQMYKHLEHLYMKTGSVKEVIKETNLSISTVYSHLRHLTKKMKEEKLHNAAQLLSLGKSISVASKSAGVSRQTARKHLVTLNKSYNADAAIENIDNNMSVSRQAKTSTKTNPNSFLATPAIDAVINLSYRLEKFKVRKWIIDTADAMLSDISAITFPGSEWLMERDLFLKCGKRVKKITAIEKDRELYEFSMHNVPPVDNVEFSHKTDSELFSSAAAQPYNLLWLDYMGPFMPSKLESFRLALENGYVADRAIVCLTFLNGRDGSMSKTYKDHAESVNDIPIGKGKYSNARLKVIPQMYADTAKPYGFTTSVISAHTYKERQGGVAKSPMLFISLLMEKQAIKRSVTAKNAKTAKKRLLEKKALIKSLGNAAIEVIKTLPASLEQIDNSVASKIKVRRVIRTLLKNETVEFLREKGSKDVIFRLTERGKKLLTQLEA